MNLLKTFPLLVLVAISLVCDSAQAQTFTVLHNFSSGADGSIPQTGVVDAAGNFYGTTYQGGTHDQCGVAFKLSEKNSQWVLSALYEFNGNGGGACNPTAGLTFGRDGALYGASFYGGTNGRGTVYKLQPSPTRCSSISCPWLETTLHSFAGGASDGEEPSAGVTFDSSGNMYGPTLDGGSPCPAPGCGVIYKLTPSGTGWVESVAYEFGGGYYGGNPNSPLTTDPAGNFYGAGMLGGVYGEIYELSPSGSGWNYSVLYRFSHSVDGANPQGALFYQGNVYGTTIYGGPGGGGIVYQLSQSSGQWGLTLLDSFGNPGDEPIQPANMVVDAQGNMYGTVLSGGQYGYGTVFKLTVSGDSWTITSLHDFEGTDGSAPLGVVLDSQGNLYGTTWGGGTHGWGVAFKITP